MHVISPPTFHSTLDNASHIFFLAIDSFLDLISIMIGPRVQASPTYATGDVKEYGSDRLGVLVIIAKNS
jgi:hypothetical protein